MKKTFEDKFHKAFKLESVCVCVGRQAGRQAYLIDMCVKEYKK